jgi:hypothetical protein
MKSPARSPQAPGHTARGRSYDRHSATGSRGLPKKGGAGGKGVWGAMLDQDAALASSPVDRNDPNYDSEEEEEERAGHDDIPAHGHPPEITLDSNPEPPATTPHKQQMQHMVAAVENNIQASATLQNAA